jgi:hypothetical protein
MTDGDKTLVDEIGSEVRLPLPTVFPVTPPQWLHFAGGSHHS